MGIPGWVAMRLEQVRRAEPVVYATSVAAAVLGGGIRPSVRWIRICGKIVETDQKMRNCERNISGDAVVKSADRGRLGHHLTDRATAEDGPCRELAT